MMMKAETGGIQGASLVAQLVKNLPVMQETICSAENMGLISGSGMSPREGNSNALQYSCLGNPMDRGAWQAIVHETVKESDMI